ncbi:MAG: transposase [Flavobacteriales bacterium]|nr:transposase [Flavobacteriales bacterium]
MSTYFKLHYHIVFATKRRVACLDKAWRAQLWEYMGGTIRGLGGVPHGVGGYNDHVHLLIDLKPTQLLPDVVRELKKASTEWVRAHHGLRSFQWQEGTWGFLCRVAGEGQHQGLHRQTGGTSWQKGLSRRIRRAIEGCWRHVRPEILPIGNTGCDPSGVDHVLDLL